MKKTHLLAVAAAAFAMTAPVLAHADDAAAPLGKGTVLITGRVTDVFSEANNAITYSGGDTGQHVSVGSSVMPTLGITYFLTDNIAVEAILGVTDHTVKAEPLGLAVYNTWVLPPVVTLQYRPLPKAPISPYVGAGVNAMVFFSGSNKNGLSTKVTDALGWALQAGVDAPIADKWTLNVDVKKVFVTTAATVGTSGSALSELGTLHSSVHLDPWVISAGVGYRF
jgi:outer membrane protein